MQIVSCGDVVAQVMRSLSPLSLRHAAFVTTVAVLCITTVGRRVLGLGEGRGRGAGATFVRSHISVFR